MDKLNAQAAESGVVAAPGRCSILTGPRRIIFTTKGRGSNDWTIPTFGGAWPRGTVSKPVGGPVLLRVGLDDTGVRCRPALVAVGTP